MVSVKRGQKPGPVAFRLCKSESPLRKWAGTQQVDERPLKGGSMGLTSARLAVSVKMALVTYRLHAGACNPKARGARSVHKSSSGLCASSTSIWHSMHAVRLECSGEVPWEC